MTGMVPTGPLDWLPSRFLRGSALFQLTGWPMVLWGGWSLPFLSEALILNHLLITAAGFWPQSRLLGPNLVRLPEARARQGEIGLTFDDGPDPAVTPRVLDLLDRYGATGSFFCIAERARRQPELIAEIQARGHRVENHSFRHGHGFALQGVAALRQELGRAQSVLTELSGRTPVFFRAPFGIRNPWVEPVLRQLGLQLASWTRRGYDSRLSRPAWVARLLLRGLAPGDILLLHDGSCARDRRGRAVVTEVLPRLLDEIGRRGWAGRHLGDAVPARLRPNPLFTSPC